MWQIFPKFRKHCIPISLKLIEVSRIPLNIYKNIPYPFKFLANIPVSLKTLPGPHIYIDTISMGFPIMYFKGSQVKFSIL